MNSIDFNGIAATGAAVAIAIATVTTSVISVGNQRTTNKLAKQQATIAAAAKAAADKVADTLAMATSTTNAKLDTIHTLVNSNMTAAMQDSLDSNRRELVWMQKVSNPDTEALEAMAVTQARINELQAQLNERATAVAEILKQP